MTSYDATFWRRYFRYYDALEQVDSYREMLDRVAAMASGSGLRVLDAGAGTGNLLPRLRARGASVVALDINRYGLLRLRRKHEDGVAVQATFEAALPLSAAGFDAACTVNVLYTLTDEVRAGALQELHRVLVPGGRLVLVVPQLGFQALRVYMDALRRWYRTRGMGGALRAMGRLLVPTAGILLYNARIQRAEQEGAYTFFTPASIRAELDSAGFTTDAIEPIYAGQCWLVTSRAR